jgi:multiple antibiotic resistance protein
MELFILTFAALFSIINPLGTVPIFVALTQEHTKKEQFKIAFWTSFNVLVILIVSFFAGKYLLIFFGISLNSLKIAGGLIIASSGFALLTGNFSEHKGMKKKKVKSDVESRSEITLTPLATPMLAGPGTISLLIAYNQDYNRMNETLIILGSVLATSISIYVILKSSQYIVKMLGASGINALSRIIGFIVIAFGIELIMSSLESVVMRIFG